MALPSFKGTSFPVFRWLSCVTFLCFQKLSEVIKFIGLDSKQYKGHSFRIGAATHAAQVGFSENAIQNMGRWKSDAVKRYIRIGSFSVKND